MNLRWCSDGFEFTCWNGEVVRGAFIIDAHDREIIAWRAIANAGISGSDVRDILLEAVETRFGGMRAPVPVEKPYSNDLRDRVVVAMATGRSCRDVGAAFDVAPSAAGNWYRRQQQMQNHAARPMGGAIGARS